MLENKWFATTTIAMMMGIAPLTSACNGEATASGQTEVDLPEGLDREDLEIVIREYILAHPEIIPEAIEILQQREQQGRVAAIRDDLERPFAGAWAGSANPDVTIVEFFDYACGFCRTSLPDIERLLREDPNVRVVFREYPILSEESIVAARVSLSAARQNEYVGFHRAMFAAGRPGEDTIAEAQGVAELNRAQVSRDIADSAIAQEIENNRRLAAQLGLSGTPSFIVGDRILAGAVGYDSLKQAVEEARASRG